MIFPLLCRPELINLPLRTLAQHTKVALGTVGNVMRQLRIRKHIVVTQDGAPHLVNLKALFQQWVMLYPTVLRPKLLIGRYQATEGAWWDEAESALGLFGVERWAAAKITQYLNARL